MLKMAENYYVCAMKFEVNMVAPRLFWKDSVINDQI